MGSIHLYDILRRPIITEKSEFQQDVLNQYSFEVDKSATKQQVKEAVELIFDVDVERVRTMVMPAKRARRLRTFYRRKKEWKKAIVTISSGQTIGLFEV